MYQLTHAKDLKDFSRKLKTQTSFADVLLWRKLSSSQLHGYTFNRQKPLDNYIVDYYCKKLKLVVEIDSANEAFGNVQVKNERRKDIIENMGLNFLHFDESQVRRDVGTVIKTIEEYITKFEDASDTTTTNATEAAAE